MKKISPFGARYGVHWYLPRGYFIGNTDTVKWGIRTMFLGKSIKDGYIIIWITNHANQD